MSQIFGIPPVELRLLSAIEKLATDRIKERQDEVDADTDLVDYYSTDLKNDLSVGSGQTSPSEERSCRALTNLIRVNEEELERVKKSLRFRRGYPFTEFALSSIILSALSMNSAIAQALRYARPDRDQPTGPFYPNKEELELMHGVKMLAVETAIEEDDEVEDQKLVDYYLSHVAKKYGAQGSGRVAMYEQSALAFAGMIKVKRADFDAVAAGLRRAGLYNERALRQAVADVIISVLRVEARFTTGLLWAQPDA